MAVLFQFFCVLVTDEEDMRKKQDVRKKRDRQPPTIPSPVAPMYNEHARGWLCF